VAASASAAQAAAGEADLRQELDEMAEDSEKLEAQVEALRMELASAKGKLEGTEVAASEATTSAMQVVEGLRKELTSTKTDLIRAQDSAKKLQGEVDAATQIFKAMRSDLERLNAENKGLRQEAEEDKQMVQRHLKEIAKEHAKMMAWEKEEIERLRKDVRAHEARVAWHADMAKRDMEAKGAEIKKLEAQVADHSRWRDEANHAASVAELEAKKLRTKLAEADWDREQLLKSVEALRFPTQKLMASNPELFAGEARGTSSPRPPHIIRLPQVKEEDTERALKFLKALVAPSRPCLLVESPSTALPGMEEAEPSTEGLCMALTEEQYKEMFGADLPPLPASPPPSPPIVPDQPKVCGAAGCIDCAPLEAKPKPDYKNPRWPSPKTKRFAKHIAKHTGKVDPKTIKTHQGALEFLANWPKISMDDLLKMEMRDYQKAYAPWSLDGPCFFLSGSASRSVSSSWWSVSRY
jgi:predicted  nucleic acid-binding Zn-ribbon protein